MAPNPAELIAQKLQALQRAGETVENGPGGSLYLSQERFFVAKYNPMRQEASVSAFEFADITEVKLETGTPMGDKEPSRFVEVGLKDHPATGLAAAGVPGTPAAEVAFLERPNVIYCGRGSEAMMVGEAIAQVLKHRHQKAIEPPPAPPPPPPPPPSNIPADWYPDPKGEKRLRYWDGTAWTDHTAD